MTAKTIERFSCNDLKLEPFNIGIEFILIVVILAVDITELENNNQTKQAHIILKTKLNSNKGKPHLKIPDTPLIFYFWTKYQLVSDILV